MTALFETYRPTTWSDVIGQDKAINRLAALQRRGLAGRAYWICGGSGHGKTSIARLIAAEVADPFCTVELDAGELTIGKLRDLERSSHTYGFGSKTGRAYIVNEAHGLSATVIRALLVTLEPIPPHIVWVFTTTVDGQESLFEDHIDAHPLLSRCTVVALTRQGLARPFAERARQIAEREGLNGKPLASYVRLVHQHHGNLRAMLTAIEFGEMKGGASCSTI